MGRRVLTASLFLLVMASGATLAQRGQGAGPAPEARVPAGFELIQAVPPGMVAHPTLGCVDAQGRLHRALLGALIDRLVQTCDPIRLFLKLVLEPALQAPHGLVGTGLGGVGGLPGLPFPR